MLVQVLHNLRGVLEDRTITLAGLPDLSNLCMELCALVSADPPSAPPPNLLPRGQVEDPRVAQLINVSSSWTRSDLSTFVHSVLTNLATYPAHLDRNAQVFPPPATFAPCAVTLPPTQLTLVCCLEAGLVGRGAHPCVSALSICTLELQATMTRWAWHHCGIGPHQPLPP